MVITNLLSIDVEDYFHVSAFEKVSPPSSWDCRQSRVDQNTGKILSLLARHNVKATFFVLGWVAERFPSLVEKIARNGHEIASHGCGHRRVNELSRTEFREDIRKSKELLENISGQTVLGYRAPSYSISNETYWAFDELLDAGYTYDSSIFPIQHDFYGMCEWPRFAGYATRFDDGSWKPRCDDVTGRSSLLEIPITTLKFAGQKIPIAGGGYFRFFPYFFTRWGLQQINEKEQQPFVFYLHPWEVDPGQPRMKGAKLKSRFRHYLNLHKTEERFKRLLGNFKFGTIGDFLEARSKGCDW